mgnify:CR=1 FL=1|jgi:hypothetical protein
MSFSSFKKSKLLFENWRGFMNEAPIGAIAGLGDEPEEEEKGQPAPAAEAPAEEVPAEEAPAAPSGGMSEQEAAQWIAGHITNLIAASATADNFQEPLAALVAQLNSAEGMDPTVRAMLHAGDSDGAPTDEAVSVGTKGIPSSQLFPTQGVIDLYKSAGFNGSVADGLRAVLGGTSGAPPILACGSGETFYIVDGHHRWSGALVYNTNANIPANVINMAPAQALLVSQLAIAQEIGGGKKLPSAGTTPGASIIGPGALGKDAVVAALTKAVGKVVDKNAISAGGGPFMNPEVQAAIKELNFGGGTVEGAINQVAVNCASLAERFPSEGPDRTIMPQFDPKVGGPKFSDVEGEFTSGELNFKDPVMPQLREQKLRQLIRRVLKESLKKTKRSK